MIKNKKSIAIFMIYLVLTITIFSSKLNFVNAAEQVNVNQASGDAAISVDILNVPSINNLNYPIMLTYSGGDGIPVNSEPTWVGLGWNLDSDTISRGVVGTPDDLNGLNPSEKDTIFLHNNEKVTDGRSWWEKWGEVILLSILAVIEIFVTILTGGTTTPYLAETISALGTVLGTIASISIMAAITLAINSVLSIMKSLITTGKVSVDITNTDLALAFIPGSMGVIQSFAEIGVISQSAFDLIKTASAISVGLTGIEGVQAALSLPGMIDIQSSKSQLEDQNPSVGGVQYANEFKRPGFLYSPFEGEQYSPHNPVIPYDGGQPDKYFASGKFNGELVLASKYNSKGDASKRQHLCNAGETSNCVPNDVNSRIPENYFQFFSKKLGGIETVKIEYKTNLDEDCSTFLPADARTSTCNQKIFQGYIDQFIITGSDGTRIVYGDPKVPGSIVREHFAGVYKQAHRDYENGKVSADLLFRYYTYTNHPLNWKVVSVLGPDYSGPLYPLENEAGTKGSWIAFKYDYAYNFIDPLKSCAYTEGIFEGETKDEWGDTLKFGKIIDKSYLSEVVTPTYVAKFYTSDRKDGLESKPWGDLWALNLTNNQNDQGTFRRGVALSIVGKYCEANQDAIEHKLDNIILMKRDGTVVQKIYFNKGVSENNQYSLKKGFSNKGNPITDHGRYTLKTVTICGVKDSKEECLDPYGFNYYDYTS